MVVSPVFSDNGDLRAWDPTVTDSAADDRLYAIVLSRVDQAVAALKGVDYRFLESPLIVASKTAWNIADE